MHNYTDEMSGGAQFAVAAGLMVVGGFAAWWLGKPAVKTAGGAGARQQAGTSAYRNDYQAGYAAGQHAYQLNKWNQVAQPQGSHHAELLSTWEASVMPHGQSQAWQNGFHAGVRASWQVDSDQYKKDHPLATNK